MTLEELRNQIDALDRQLVELLSERARAAKMVGHLKAATSCRCMSRRAKRWFMPTCARPTKARCRTSN